jgi:hypothetical protein
MRGSLKKYSLSNQAGLGLRVLVIYFLAILEPAAALVYSLNSVPAFSGNSETNLCPSCLQLSGRKRLRTVMLLCGYR